ncbi:MAG: hypothetical protein CML39_05055 [Rhodobacteraceae bacterium]|nr:MAG: hypothetical protein CML39_05055 [Paracoccaceae bacterium]
MDISKVKSDLRSTCKDLGTEETLELQEKNKIPNPVRVNAEPKGLPPKVMLKLLNDKSEYIDKCKSYIRELGDNLRVSNCTLPKFWDLSQKLNSYDDNFLQFYSFILLNHKLSSSQLFQDLFVLFSLEGKRDGQFLEFGATDGRNLSNTFSLEAAFGWQGVLAEPSPQWHDKLRSNRPNATIITDCIYSESGRNLDFFVSSNGELSSLEEFRNSSQHGNNQKRNENGYNTQVSSVSLNDVFVKHFDSKSIEYMSVDTEGCELLILKNFDFQAFGAKIINVEHNYQDNEKELDVLLAANNYRRVFSEFSQFDGWYIRDT